MRGHPPLSFALARCVRVGSVSISPFIMKERIKSPVGEVTARERGGGMRCMLARTFTHAGARWATAIAPLLLAARRSVSVARGYGSHMPHKMGQLVL